MTVVPEEGGRLRPLQGLWAGAATLVAVAMSVFQLWAIYVYILDPWLLRAFHLLFAMVLAFLLLPARARGPQHRPSAVDVALGLLALPPVVYIVIDYDDLIFRAGSLPTMLDVVLAGLLVVLLLEATRRSTGPALPIISLVFIVYAVGGDWLPPPFGHRGYPLGRTLSLLYSPDGIYGIPLGASALYVFLFVLFGAFLSVARADRFFVNLALSLAGRLRGGPAKVSIISSSLFGTVSGSAVANVMVDGVINIPLMKATGFRAVVAGAVEAVTSTGGQIVPPVMGAAAFLMAEILGISYAKIAVAAAIPAILYYVATYWMIDFEAAKMRLRGLPAAQLPGLGATLRGQGYLLLPIVALLTTLMVLQFSPARAALVGIGTVLLILAAPVVLAPRRTRALARQVVTALGDGPRGTIDIALTCACAGIVVGVLSLTGLGLKFASIVVTYSGQQLWLGLVLTMLVTLVLGMGMPTVAAYAMAATVAVPAIVQLGADRLAAHMFVFYFACISSITPPVALAAFAAASLAGANVWQVGVYATRLGIAGFIIPFMFVYGPPLLFQGSWPDIIVAFVTASVGTLCLAAGVQGWLLRAAGWWERAILLVAALLLIKPGWKTDVVGLVLLGIVLAHQWWRPAER